MIGVIVVDAGRSRPTCRGRDAYIHDQLKVHVVPMCGFGNFWYRDAKQKVKGKVKTKQVIK